MGEDESAGLFKDVPDRDPVFARRLHADIYAVVVSEPRGEAAQVSDESGKTLGSVGGDPVLVS
jgi:hypothetical protein